MTRYLVFAPASLFLRQFSLLSEHEVVCVRRVQAWCLTGWTWVVEQTAEARPSPTLQCLEQVLKAFSDLHLVQVKDPQRDALPMPRGRGA